MGYKTLCFGFFCILFAYCIYSPLPENIEEPWKVRFMDVLIKMTSHVATLLENIGLMKYEEVFSTLATVHFTKPISDENITVTDTNFSDIFVRLYLPKKKSEKQRPAVLFIHGGVFVFGSCKMSAYDDLNRLTANRLDAVVVGIDYRLAPQYQFPVAFEDCLSVVKFFLQDKVLAEYGVDPSRICIMGESSGAALTASVIQRLQNDPKFKNRIKAQALIYPGLQSLDTFLPSHREYEHGPILSRDMAIKLACLYVTKDKAFIQAALRNEHMPEESRHLFKFVNWSEFLPEKYKKNHVYTEPVLGKLNVSYPALMDRSVSPLLFSDSQLQNLPLTYILTCEHDLIRDDGLIFVTRLRNVGVRVTHDHIEEGVHGAMSFTRAPVFLHLGLRLREKYISWLEKNLKGRRSQGGLVQHPLQEDSLSSPQHQDWATLFENMGFMKYEEFFSILVRTQLTKPISDENITVIDTDFKNIPVRLYLPKTKSEKQRPAIIYIHGGAFSLASCRIHKTHAYDFLNRWTANKLDAIVVGIEYRLAPQHPFPAALEDCVLAITYFLQDTILDKYGVDPARICISGDSSGGTLAAAATQMLQENPKQKDKIKAQALIYPSLQWIDTFLPSHREYEHGPILSREMIIKLACLYVTEDKALTQAVLRNEHMPEGSRHLFKFVNWSEFLPEKYKKNHVYTEPVLGKLNASYPALVDSRVSPLLASDSQLQNLPLTYILTCEHDLVRDDGLIYVTRLRNVGVRFTHDHIEEGVHGALAIVTASVFLHSGATLFENMGLMKFEDFFIILMNMQNTEPISDENITVIDTDFSNIPVRLYLPKRKSEIQRPAIIYIHGGAFITGSSKMLPYDSLNRFTANKLEAVVIAPDYRLAPQYPFPASLEDCISVVKFVLQDKILAEYGVDPSRICISGDSSGGNMVASVIQQLQNDPEYKNKIKAQVLLYPGLQTIDTLTPSYQKYEHGPFLSRNVAIKMASLYVTDDEQLRKAILRNEHIPEESRHLFKFVNWSEFLPEKYKKNHVYTEPILGKLNASCPALMDNRVSPLLVSDAELQRLPLTYIITCEHDILRDDGLMVEFTCFVVLLKAEQALENYVCL
ncbi:arylacetamide deacetylase-like 2 [Sigmodon hispidus]